MQKFTVTIVVVVVVVVVVVGKKKELKRTKEERGKCDQKKIAKCL